MRAVLPESRPARPDTLAPTLVTRVRKNLNRALAFRIFLLCVGDPYVFRLSPISSSSGIEKLVFSSRRLQEDVYDSNLDSTSD
jgi:hypothetical protein